MEVEVGGRVRRLDVRKTGRAWAVSVDGRTQVVDAQRVGDRWSLLVGEEERGTGGPDPGPARVQVFRSYEIGVEDRRGGQFVVYVNGCAVGVSVPRLRRRAASGPARPDSEAGPRRVLAPMPGRVVKVLVAPGDLVEAGQGLVVVEAMKMENELRSPRRGRVSLVSVVEGALVEAHSVLVVVE
jgi:biotin carboxyl carrier protein